MRDRKTPAAAAILIAGAVVLGGCAGAGGPSLGPVAGITTGSVDAQPGANAAAAASKSDAGDKVATTTAGAAKGVAAVPGSTLALARSLRDKGDKTKALAELERGRKEKPGDRELAREAGILALELGQLDRAKTSLLAALDPAKPDFHVLSALGTVHASSGNQQDAQANFRHALKLRPDHQPTLNNLALSYVLDGELAKAESTLKSASKNGQTTQKVKENLALVLALSGKYDDAEKVVADVMPKAKAAANMAYLRSLTEKEKGG